METGTGKTYVYTHTIYELNRHYGLTKFVIVVPVRGHLRGREEVLREHQDPLPAALRPHAARVLRLRFGKLGAVTNFAVRSSI